ncbi:hypothetical protein LXL04_011419 [Taraxacum kok-saghyz]
MDSFMGSIKSAVAGSQTEGDTKSTNTEQPSSTELLSSAKQVAEAAKLAASNQTEKIDKAKTAGAAADVLDAAQKYGKFDETQGVGQYLKKADDYLHEYEKSGATATTPPPAKEGEAAPPPPAEEKKSEKEESGSGFGAGDALKAAGSSSIFNFFSNLRRIEAIPVVPIYGVEMRLNTSVNGSTQWIPSIDCASVSIDLRIRYHMNVGILDVCKNEYIPNIRDIVSDYVGILDVCKNEYIPNIRCRTQIMQKKCSRIGCCTKESAAALNNWLLKKTFEE